MENEAVVSYHVSRTLNFGKFESVKIQAGLELSTSRAKLSVDKAYAYAKKFVDAKIEEETTRWQQQNTHD